jgi:hypothetical protein
MRHHGCDHKQEQGAYEDCCPLTQHCRPDLIGLRDEHVDAGREHRWHEKQHVQDMTPGHSAVPKALVSLVKLDVDVVTSGTNLLVDFVSRRRVSVLDSAHTEAQRIFAENYSTWCMNDQRTLSGPNSWRI